MDARRISVVCGLAAGFGVAVAAPASAVVGPAEVSFRTVRVGNHTNKSIALTVANGEQVVAARIEGSDQFEIVDDDCAGTPPAGRCRVDVRFAPTAAGPEPATLHVGDAVVRLNAAAYGIGPSLVVSPAGLSWPGGVTVDSERTARLTNRGDEPIRVTRLTISGRDGGSFSLGASDCAGRRLAPAERCEIAVRLRSPGGTRRAKLNIATELPQAPYSVDLRTDTSFSGRPRPVCPCATMPHSQSGARPAWSFGIVRARFINRVVADVYTSLAARLSVTVFRGSTAVKTSNTRARVTGQRGVEVRVSLKRGGYRVRVVARRPGDSRTTWTSLTVR